MTRVGVGAVISLGFWAGACVEDPSDHVAAAFTAAVEGGPELRRALHPDYQDPLGDLEQLLADLRAHPLTSVEVRQVRTRYGATRRQATVDVDYVAHWPNWRVEGTSHVAVERGPLGHTIRSGFLTGARDVQAMVDDLLRAAAPAEAMAAVHRNYAQGLEARADLRQRWGAGRHPSGAPWSEVERIELVQGRLELRPDRSHLDVHLRLPDPGGPRPVTLRLTLAPSAGRWRIVEGFGG